MDFKVDDYIIISRLMKKSEGTTVQEIAETLNLTERRVRDILPEMYFINPYDEFKVKDDRRIRYRSIGDYPDLNLPDFKLTDDELAVFNQIRENAQLNPSLRETAQHLFQKLQLMAAERGKKIKVENSSRQLILNSNPINKSIDSKASKNANTLIRQILFIIKKQQWMDIEYRPMKSVDSINWEKLYPLQLFTSNGDTYLYVLTRKKDLKMLAIERLIKINAAYPGERVEVLYDFKKLLSDPFGIMPEKLKPYKVILWVNDWETKYLKDKDWPDSVKITTNDDGSSIFEAETRTHYECIAWIQARIDRVKILEPQWLKDEIMANLNLAIAQNS